MSDELAELAAKSFDADERVRMLGMMNMPTDYKDRRKAHVEMVLARAKSAKLAHDLEEAIFRSAARPTPETVSAPETD